jgi:hypothetical protein
MPSAIVKLTLDHDVLDALTACAIAERRPLPWQADVMLRRALGLPFPCTTSTCGDTHPQPANGERDEHDT